MKPVAHVVWFFWLMPIVFAAVATLMSVFPVVRLSAANNPTVKWTIALKQAQDGHVEHAVQNLRTIEPTAVSPGLLHNLGNAEYKLGQLGPAVLAWERARALDPGFRNTTGNLRFARGQAGLSEPEWAWHEKYSALFTPDTWLWIATGAFWLAAALLALPPLLRRKRTAWTQGGAVVAIGVFLLTVPALVGIASRGKVGVVLAAETVLRLTPTKEGEMLGKLAEGELARAEKSRGAYVYVRGASDRAGWVQREEFAKIWP